MQKDSKQETEETTANNGGLYLEEGGDFCKGCGWNLAGDCHDAVGRLFYFDPCPECGRTAGQADA